MSGSLRATDTLYSTTAQFQILRAPTTSDGTTFGPGSANNLLKSNGTSVYWTTLVANDIPNLNTSKLTEGTLGYARGGTGQNSWAKGDLLYASTANTLSKLTATNDSTKRFLSCTSQVPSWTTLAKGDVGLGNVENTALSTWTGSNKIATVGTITTGTWQGTAIAASYIGSHSTDKLNAGTLPIGRGGTGTTTAPTQYGVIYASTTSAYASTGAGTSGQYLKSNGTSAPTWATFSASTVGLGNVTNAAQITKATFTKAYQIMYSTAASTPAVLDANTTATKKFLRMTGTGSAGTAPAWDTLVLNDIPDLSTLYLPRSGGTLTNTAGTRINFNDGTRIQYWIGLSSNSQYQGLYSTGYLDSNSTWNESTGYIIRRINNGKVFIDFPTVIQDDTVSSSKTTGALVIQGGLGVAKTIFANNLAITDNNPVIRVSGVDATATNNGVTATAGKYWMVGDEAGNGYSAFYGAANSDGSVTSYLLSRTYDSSESKFRAFGGIGVKMSSTGTISYIISGPAAFRNAIGASSGVWPVDLGGTGVTSIANIQAGKDGDGNTISSTYLKRTAGTSQKMTGSLYFTITGNNSCNSVSFGSLEGGTTYKTITRDSWGYLTYYFPYKNTSNAYITNSYFSFIQYSASSSNGTASGGYERYNLPITDANKTSGTNYNILTTKNLFYREGAIENVPANSMSSNHYSNPFGSSENYIVVVSLRTSSSTSLQKFYVSSAGRSASGFDVYAYNGTNAAATVYFNIIAIQYA